MSRGHGKMELYVLAALTHGELTTAALAAKHPSVGYELPSQTLRSSLNRALRKLQKSGRIRRINCDGLNGWTLCEPYAGDRRRTAYHEAGHAVIARVLGIGVKHATIKPKGISAGHVMLVRRFVKDTSTEALQNSAIIDAAGRLAETLLPDDDTRRWCVPEEKVRRFGARNDRLLMRWTTEELVCKQAVEGTLNDRFFSFQAAVKSTKAKLGRKSKKMVLEHWKPIEHVAEALIKNETLSGAEIDAILEVYFDDG